MHQYKKRDHYSREAERHGYVARSAWKLQEIHQRFRLLSSGQRVLDLGAAPGSWSQYALSKIGAGHIIAVDLQELKIHHAQVTFIRGSITDEVVRTQIADHGPYDVLISDLAPHTTGNRIVDTAASEELFLSALQIARHYLCKGGSFVVKIFQGECTRDACTHTDLLFDNTHVFKPTASRSRSFETYLIGIHKHAA